MAVPCAAAALLILGLSIFSSDEMAPVSQEGAVALSEEERVIPQPRMELLTQVRPPINVLTAQQGLNAAEMILLMQASDDFSSPFLMSHASMQNPVVTAMHRGQTPFVEAGFNTRHGGEKHPW